MAPLRQTPKALAPYLLSLLLSGALSSCAAPLSTSRYGFNAFPNETVPFVDIAWFAVADAATKTYGELAMVHFAARNLTFEVEFTVGGEAKLSPGLIRVPWHDCIAESELLYVFAGIVSNILGRNEMDAGDKAAVKLQAFCH